jgi:hypothetical protein
MPEHTITTSFPVIPGSAAPVTDHAVPAVLSEPFVNTYSQSIEADLVYLNILPIAELLPVIVTDKFPVSEPVAIFTYTLMYTAPVSIPLVPLLPDCWKLVGAVNPDGVVGVLVGYLLAIAKINKSPAAIDAGYGTDNVVVAVLATVPAVPNAIAIKFDLYS